ncbi:MAG: hypothetical protein IT186_25230 [Acidobacteria bacterium]|nr:hypothetical protein [Acidobacteriota bacterium]MCG3195354.1 hypothetical protein [Thermoanaerobaculia bacterium]
MRKLMLVGALVLFASAPALATYEKQTRAIYWGGQIHYMSIDSSQKVDHMAATVPSGWKGPWDDSTVKTTASLPSGYKRQEENYSYAEGQGVVVFGSLMIHYAVVWNSSSQPRLVATRYDLSALTTSGTKGAFVDTTARDIFAVPNTGAKSYGISAVVFQGKIYLFASDYILISEDGVNYQLQSAVLANGLTGLIAVDALTYYTSSGTPNVMVLFIKPGTAGAVLGRWDGVTALPLASWSVLTVPGDSQGYPYHAGGLLLGTSGTSSSSDWKFNTGQKHLCVQTFLVGTVNGWGWLDRYEYDIETDQLSDGGGFEIQHAFYRMRIFPWYEPATDSLGRPVQKQSLGVNFYQCNQPGCTSHSWQCLGLASDYLVSTKQDPSTGGGYGWQGIPTSTSSGTPEEEAVRRNYWSLIGVALGPAPFAENGKEAFEVAETSFIDYGIEYESSIEHKSSWAKTYMVGSATEVKEGLPKKVGLKQNFDVSYKWGTIGSQTDETQYSTKASFIMGTKDEAEGNFGEHGWALFSAPTFLTQVGEIFAYDYSVTSSTGTDLHLRLPSVLQAGPPSASSPVPMTILSQYFKLDDPGGTDDQVAGMMSGLPAYPPSTDLEAWHLYDWVNSANGRWQVLFGPGGVGGGTQINRVSQGNTGSVTFGSGTTSITASGTTSAVSVEAGVGISAKIKIVGFDETLKAGYDSEFETETTTETGFSQDIKLEWGMTTMPSACTAGDCVKNMSVQPYILKALTADAPWIPAGYALNLPWAMTWWVHDYEYMDGRKGGVAAMPTSVGGTVTGVAGEVRGSGARSDYAVDGGHLAWTNADGTTTPIPITADQFQSKLGASIFIGSRQLSATPETGRWTRSGRVWTFKTAKSATRDIFTLTLDFGKGRWSFAGTKMTLSEYVRAGKSHIRLGLKVNGLYRFTTDVSHDMALTWDVRPAASDAARVQLTRLTGAHSTITGAGHVSLHGTLPSSMPAFGDVSIVMNGHQVDFPLLSLDGAQDAFENGKVLIYQDEGRQLHVDFGKKTWAAKFSGKGFHPAHVPLEGTVRLAIKVGGQTWHQQDHEILAFTADLAAND